MVVVEQMKYLEKRSGQNVIRSIRQLKQNKHEKKYINSYKIIFQIQKKKITERFNLLQECLKSGSFHNFVFNI